METKTHIKNGSMKSENTESEQNRCKKMKKEKMTQIKSADRADIIFRTALFVMISLLLVPFFWTGEGVRTADAKNLKTSYMIEQAQGKAPYVKVYMTGSKMKNNVSAAGKVGDYDFKTDGDIKTFGKTGEGICYIILFDNSGSVNRTQYTEAKKQLLQLRKSLRKNDKLLLYTVGTQKATGNKKNVLGRTVKGDEKNKISGDLKKIRAIPYLNTAKSKSVLYRALNEVLTSQTSPSIRTVTLLITDGEDDSEGKDIDKVSTAKTVADSKIPVYGILLHNDLSVPNKKKMQYTQYKILDEKNCRGYYEDCSTGRTASSVAKAFKNLKDIWMNKSYRVRLKTDTNKTVVNARLNVTINQKSAVPESFKLDYTAYEKDTSAPVLVGEVAKASKNSIRFTLSDNYGIKEEDAKNTSHYTVQSKTKKGDGKVWKIDAASAVPDGNDMVVTLTFKEDLYTDDYSLKCSDIHDDSQDANALNTTTDFSIKDGVSKSAVERKEFIRTYWWIVLVLAVVVVGVLIILVIRKKMKNPSQVAPEELSKADTRMIRLTITDRAGMIKDVEWNVEGSLFVGRSDICNIYFDDERLSKQHFVIEVTKMGCYIEDLESTNGTFVNGVKITNRRMLLDEDVITAGREKFVFHLPKNQPEDLEGIEDMQAM